jgi:hydroxymethylpyrimidine pyrophosphatase-like HAD family hydrolase
MRFFALAAGFDGTLARNGRYDERCIEALKALATTGRKLILVTARELRELLEVFPEARLFDFIVAENGAVMHRSATRESEILAQAPSEILLQELGRRRIAPLFVGSSIIRTSASNEREVRSAIEKLHLDCQLVHNDHSLIILPAGVNKASGVKEALRQLGLSAHNLAVIGDAQNDLTLFQLAEHAVAVENAHPLLKQCADRTTRGAYCEGFLELCRDLMDGDLAYAQPKVRFALGRRNEFEEFSLSPCFDSLLVCGARGQGKAAFCRNLFSQLLVHGYQCCLIDASKSPHPTPAGMQAFGSDNEAPRLSTIVAALEQSSSVDVNLSALPAESRPVFLDALLLQMQALHDRVGRPHAVLVRHAHWFLSDGAARTLATRLTEMTIVYESAEPERLPAEILEGVSTAMAFGNNATIPRQFSGFGSTMAMQIDDPEQSGGERQGIPAQVWIRSQRSTHRNPLQAIAGGAACVIPGLRGSEPSSVAASSDELSSFSGY